MADQPLPPLPPPTPTTWTRPTMTTAARAVDLALVCAYCGAPILDTPYWLPNSAGPYHAPCYGAARARGGTDAPA